MFDGGHRADNAMRVRRPQFTVRLMMVAVAVVAVTLNGLQDLPALLKEGFLYWQGVRYAQRRFDLITVTSGPHSGSARRAKLNVEQSEIQFKTFCHRHLARKTGLWCAMVSGLWLLSLAFGPLRWGVCIILRRIENRSPPSSGANT
jgi:hypothetical protein